MELFTSDTHFGHKNIILYCNRPWIRPDGQPDADAMDEALVENWNAEVKPGDTVYHLGDFGFSSPTRLRAIRERLNGRIILIAGNHDYHGDSRKPEKWLKPTDELHARLHLGPTLLTHVPPVFDTRDRYTWEVKVPPGVRQIICGHVHDQWTRFTSPEGLPIFNVSVEVRDYRPVTAEQIGVTL